MPICIEYSATRAARFAARTATNVASASTSVPSAVKRDATVDQSRIDEAYRRATETDPEQCPLVGSLCSMGSEQHRGVMGRRAWSQRHNARDLSRC